MGEFAQDKLVKDIVDGLHVSAGVENAAGGMAGRSHAALLR